MTIQADFITVASELGENISWFKNTEVIDSQTGDNINSYGSNTSITAIVNKVSKDGKTINSGYIEGNELVIYTDNTNNVSIFDKLTIRSVDYVVSKLLAEGTYNGKIIFRKWFVKRIVGDGS